MAVTTTVQDILNGAYSHSMQNNPGTIATETTELLYVVQRAIDGCYGLAARVNPTFFADQAQVAAPGAATPWARPEEAESIFRIEMGGTEVVVVPYDDRGAEALLPAVYEWGKNFYTVGGTPDPDPSADALDFFFATRPARLTATTDTLDPMWDETYNELLMLEVAIYLAIKDGPSQGRAPEIQAFAGERLRWANRFVAFLEHATPIQRRRWGHVRRFNTEALLPVFGFADVNVSK